MAEKNQPEDLTPEVGAETDVAPLGRSGAKPPHEQTADEDVDVADWGRIAASEEFKKLLQAKARFIVPATIFFVVYYFLLPILVGYAHDLMATRVIGVVNIAYLFALSQFIMTWVLAAIYVRKAGTFDKMAADILERLQKGKEQKS